MFSVLNSNSSTTLFKTINFCARKTVSTFILLIFNSLMETIIRIIDLKLHKSIQIFFRLFGMSSQSRRYYFPKASGPSRD